MTPSLPPWDRRVPAWVMMLPRGVFRHFNSCQVDFFLMFPFGELKTNIEKILTEMYQATKRPTWIHWGMQRDIIQTKIMRCYFELGIMRKNETISVRVFGFGITVAVGAGQSEDEHRYLYFEIPTGAEL